MHEYAISLNNAYEGGNNPGWFQPKTREANLELRSLNTSYLYGILVWLKRTSKIHRKTQVRTGLFGPRGERKVSLCMFKMHSFLPVPQELCNIWGEGRGMETPPPAPLQYTNQRTNLTASPSHMHVKPSHYANTFCLETNKNNMSVFFSMWAYLIAYLAPTSSVQY